MTRDGNGRRLPEIPQGIDLGGLEDRIAARRSGGARIRSDGPVRNTADRRLPDVPSGSDGNDMQFGRF